MRSRRFQMLSWSLVAAAAVALGGCGLGSAQEQREQPLSLLLDAPPSAVHAGIYAAVQRDFDRGEGLALSIRRPRRTSDPVQLLRRERVDAAVLTLADFTQARRPAGELVAVAALVQTPLTAVLARRPVTTPRDLENRTVGVPPGSFGRALVTTMVQADRGAPAQVDFAPATTGIDGALKGRRLDAVVGRRDVGLSGVEDFRVLKPEDHGVPRHPELVLVVKRRTLDERRAGVRSLIRTLQRGYRQAQTDPEGAVGAMLEVERRLDRNELLADLNTVAPSWTAGARAFGELDAGELKAWQRWAVKHRVLRRELAARDAFAFDLVGRLANP